MSIIVALDGVLRDDHGDPVHAGLKIFHALSANYRVLIATDSNAAEAERWCLLQGITEYGVIIDNSLAWPDRPLREAQIDAARQHGQRIELVVDADADVALYAVSVGIPVMLFAAPKPTKPNFGIRRWDEVTAEIQRQKEMAAGVDSHVEAYE